MQFDLEANFSLRINGLPMRASVGGPGEEKTEWCNLASFPYTIGHNSSIITSEKCSIKEPKLLLFF